MPTEHAQPTNPKPTRSDPAPTERRDIPKPERRDLPRPEHRDIRPGR